MCESPRILLLEICKGDTLAGENWKFRFHGFGRVRLFAALYNYVAVRQVEIRYLRTIAVFP
jgi:hypothetical protein